MQTDTHPIDQRESRSPIELELGDGSRLVLEESETPPRRRIDGELGRISLDDAMQMSGQPFAGYRLLRN